MHINDNKMITFLMKFLLKTTTTSSWLCRNVFFKNNNERLIMIPNNTASNVYKYNTKTMEFIVQVLDSFIIANQHCTGTEDCLN